MKKRYLIVKNQKAVTRVDADEIMYVLRDGRRLIVATEEREYVYYDKMKSVEGISNYGFYQPLDRCIINMKHLKSVEVVRRRLVFRNGDELFLGRDACSRMKSVFNEYLIKNQSDDVLFAAEEEEGYISKQ